MTRKRYFGFFAVALAVTVALMTVSTAPVAADTIKLGVAGPHSGDLASYEIPTTKAAELVVKDINAKGGVLGKQVEAQNRPDRDHADVEALDTERGDERLAHAEFADDATRILLIDDSGDWVEHRIGDLLPMSFHLPR